MLIFKIRIFLLEYLFMTLNFNFQLYSFCNIFFESEFKSNEASSIKKTIMMKIHFSSFLKYYEKLKNHMDEEYICDKKL
jgi:hypothetical protein